MVTNDYKRAILQLGYSRSHDSVDKDYAIIFSL